MKKLRVISKRKAEQYDFLPKAKKKETNLRYCVVPFIEKKLDDNNVR